MELPQFCLLLLTLVISADAVCDTAAYTKCDTDNSAGIANPATKCASLVTYSTCMTALNSTCHADAGYHANYQSVIGDACMAECVGQSFCPAATSTTSVTLKPSNTTTLTPYDSSYESSAASDSHPNSLESWNSESLHDPAHSGSGLSGSSSSYTSSGSESAASGSSGSFLELWQWLFLAALLCCCLACCLAALTTCKKPKKAKTARRVHQEDRDVEKLRLMEDDHAYHHEQRMPPLMVAQAMPTTVLPTTVSSIPSFAVAGTTPTPGLGQPLGLAGYPTAIV